MNTATAPQRDPLGESIRKIAQSRALIVGLIAAAATIVVSWVVVFVLGLIPSEAVQGALGMKLVQSEPFSFGARLVRALFAPWNSAVWVRVMDARYGSTGVLLFPALIVSAVTVVVGLMVRQLVGATMRSRLTALLVAALAGGSFVGLCAAVLTYSVTFHIAGGDEGSASVANVVYHFSHRGGALFLSVFVITLVVGAFSYGVVGLLPRQFASAARSGGLYVAIPLVVVGVLFPFAVVARSVSHVTGGTSAFWNGSQYSAGVASATVPLAYGAKAALQPQGSLTPFLAGYSTKSGRDMYRWTKLQKYMVKHGSGRVWGYAGAYGTTWKLLGILLALLMVAAWAYVVVLHVVSLGAPRSVDGLRLGLIAGVAGAIAVYVVTGLAKYTYSFTADTPQRLVWGVTGSAATQAAGLMLLVGGVTGLVYAAYRPSPLRYKPLSLAKLTGTPGTTGSLVQRLDAVLPPEAPPASEAAGAVDAGTPTAEVAGTMGADAPTAVAATPDVSSAQAVAEPDIRGEVATPETRGAARFCPECGTAYPSDEHRFCRSCGAARPGAV